MPKHAAVLGSPVAHSLSPVLHAAGYAALGLTDWEYTRVELPREALAAYVQGLDATWRGLSLTMPLKEVAFDVAAQVSPVARVTGAINTLIHREDGSWDGHNTDVAGIVLSLAEFGVEQAESAVLVGSGATARSVVAALVTLGVRRLDFMVRGDVRPETLAQAQAAGFEVGRCRMGQWPGDFDVVVSTVPEGVHTAAATLRAGGRLMLDVVYADGPSALATAAERHGYAVVPGTAMLLHQAAEQFLLMTGHAAPVEAMRAALDQAVATRSLRSAP